MAAEQKVNPRWRFLAGSPTAHLVYDGASLALCAGARGRTVDAWADVDETLAPKALCGSCSKMDGVPQTSVCPVCAGRGRVIVEAVR